MSKQRFGGLKHGQCLHGPRGKKMANGGSVSPARPNAPKPSAAQKQAHADAMAKFTKQASTKPKPEREKVDNSAARKAEKAKRAAAQRANMKRGIDPGATRRP